LIFFPKKIILLFFFRLADVFPQRDNFAGRKNISEPKEEQQKDLFGGKHQRAEGRTAK
jgi:hypothetical protein